MKNKTILMNLALVLVLILSACGAAANDAMEKSTEPAMMDKPTEESMMDKPTEDALMPHDTPVPESTAETTDEAMEDNMTGAPAWFSTSLTNVQDGSVFTIQDLKGKVVLVETMAIWCPKCKQQQMQVQALHTLLGERDDFVSLGLDVDPNETADALKSYVSANGFDWHYAVPPTEVVQEIASLYGDQFLNPTSTPMLIIDRKGEAHPLPFGVKNADDLLNALQPYLDEPM